MKVFNYLYEKKDIVTICFRTNMVKGALVNCAKRNSEFVFKKCDSNDLEKIAKFYSTTNKYLQDTRNVRDEMEKGNEFYAIEKEETIVACMELHYGIVSIQAPSFEAMKSHRNEGIKLNPRTVYSSHNLVAEQFRGQGLFKLLFESVINCIKENIDNYIIITGYDNRKMLNMSMKYGGEVIGLSLIYRWFHCWYHRVHFYFKERKWEIVEMNDDFLSN